MDWVEIINARVADGAAHRELKELFRELCFQVEADREKMVRFTLYRNGLVENDWSIHLCWNSEHKPAEKSELGLKLAELLRPIAMVDHTIWIEARRKIGKEPD